MSYQPMPRPDQAAPQDRPTTLGAIAVLEGRLDAIQREMGERESATSTLRAQVETHQNALRILSTESDSIIAGIQALKAGA